MPQHTVSKGECIASLAEAQGMTVDKIWKDGQNSELRESRENPHLVVTGDQVEVPELEKKESPGPVDQRHRFRILGRPTSIRLRILRFGEPVKNAKYQLTCGDTEVEGLTDTDGFFEEKIIATDTTAYLKIERDEGEGEDEIELEVGDLAPVSELVGVQARLANLGYDTGPIDGEMNLLTRQALEIFQEDYGLDITREPDQTTRDKLEELHGI